MSTDNKSRPRTILIVVVDHLHDPRFPFVYESVRGDPHLPVTGIAMAALYYSGAFGRTGDKITWGAGPAANYSVLSWELVRMPSDARVGHVPHPGMIFLVNEPSVANFFSLDAFHFSADEARDFSTRAAAGMAKANAVKMPEVSRYLGTAAAEYEPWPLPKFDVFVSYSKDNQSLAEEFFADLTKVGLRVFLFAKNVDPGSLWTEDIRIALEGSQAVLLLLTRESVASKWVMCEAGAFWALRKTLYPAVLGVNIADLPELIRQHQAVNIETTVSRQGLVAKIAQKLLPAHVGPKVIG